MSETHTDPEAFGVSLGAKIAGVHWQYSNLCYQAEILRIIPCVGIVSQDFGLLARLFSAVRSLLT